MTAPASSAAPHADRVGVGIAFAIATSLIFSAQDGLTKYLAERYPPEFFLTLRFWAFAAFALAFAQWRAPGGAWGALTAARSKGLQIARGLLIITEILVFSYGVKHMPLSDFMAIFAINPLLTTAFAALFMGEKVGWRRWAAIGAAIVGMLIILRPGSGVFGPAALLAVLSATMYSVYVLLTRKAGRTDGLETSLLYFALVGAAAVTPGGIHAWSHPTPGDWLWIAGLCSTGVAAHFCHMQALRHAPASTIQPYTYIGLVAVIMVGVFAFGERPDRWTFIGAAIIVTSGIYALWRERVHARAQKAASP